MKPRFIKLHDPDGSSMLVNVNHIVAVRYDDDEKCYVVDTVDGSYLSTLSKFEYIETLIKATFY